MAAPPEIEGVAMDQEAKHVRIWVRDEGIGIPREAHQKVFGIFERGLSSESYDGTGVGLAIVARAVQRMGGPAASNLNSGREATFGSIFLRFEKALFLGFCFPRQLAS